jgi:hypothetical protein
MQRITELIKTREGYKKLFLYTDRLNNTSETAEIIEISKSIVEAICKTILGDFGESINPKDSFSSLLRQTIKRLPLIADLESRDKDNVKNLINGILTFGNAASTLRNSHSLVAHGQDLYKDSFDEFTTNMFMDMCDILGSYLLRAHFNYTSYNKLERATYGDHSKFDEWFDENYGEEIKIRLGEDEMPLSPSEVLFYCDREAYKSQLILFEEGLQDGILS